LAQRRSRKIPTVAFRPARQTGSQKKLATKRKPQGAADRHIVFTLRKPAFRPVFASCQLSTDSSDEAFLSWMSLVASALDRKLFLVADMQDVGYWVAKIQSEVVLHPFIVAYGYNENIEKLIRYYRRKGSPYKDWVFPINVGLERCQGGLSVASSPEDKIVRKSQA
jgi:hypothetical protein